VCFETECFIDGSVYTRFRGSLLNDHRAAVGIDPSGDTCIEWYADIDKVLLLETRNGLESQATFLGIE
jgi:hypothetical protein